jgi:uracil-DNA glycosylase family 4
MSPRKATAVAAPVEENIFEAIALPEQGVSDPEQALRIIQKDLGDCKRCELHKQRKHIVFGDGNPEAELMFVGEGPGADEDKKGKPFVGRPAGERLNNMIIKEMGMERGQVYVANIVMCRPPDKRTPKRNRRPDREECATCSPFLRQQIDVIKPKVIVALGATAARTLLNRSSSIAELRDGFHHYPPTGVRSNDPNWDGCQVKVTYHPASRRGEWRKGEAWKDLQMVMKELGLKVPKANM